MTNSPSPLGKLLHQEEDEVGPINIYQNQHLRYLTFGNQTEQSCLVLDRPHRLEHAYTQAMMLSLLMKKDSRQVLLLGLGGGSLARALRHCRPKMSIDAIEYRQAVIDLARRYFALPDDRHFSVFCDDARHYIGRHSKTHDLIFMDLYLPQGMDNAQLDNDFLNQCQQNLNDNGVLVFNFWSNDFQRTLRRQQTLKTVFDERTLSLQVPGGNTIIFAFKDAMPAHLKNKNALFKDAQALGTKLDIPLQQVARSLWQQNAQVLKLGLGM